MRNVINDPKETIFNKVVRVGSSIDNGISNNNKINELYSCLAIIIIISIFDSFQMFLNAEK